VNSYSVRDFLQVAFGCWSKGLRGVYLGAGCRKAVQSAEDMVFAGSVPEQLDDPLSRLHRQTSNLVLATSLMIVLLVAGVVISVVPDLTIIIIFPILILLWVWNSFRNRRSFALVLAQIQLGFAALFFAIFGFAHLLQGLTGSGWDLILGGLMIYMTISTFRRSSLLGNQLFAAWYHGEKLPFAAESSLGKGEILATCPHCISVLAIQPELLSPDDKCPNCDGNLVLDKGEKAEEE